MKRLALPFIFCTVSLIAAAQSYAPQQADPKMKVRPAVPLKAWSFALGDVKLLPGSPFKAAMDRDAGYLLALEPNRLLHRFYENAHLPTKGDVYGGWETMGLSGHSLGHYLSAIAMMFVSTGNPAFKERTNYIVDELERCQQARKTGYVGAIPNEDTLFARVARGDIKSGGFDLNGGWSPWYTVHKVMAGLVDAYLYTGNKKAMKVVTGMADWTYNTINHLPDSLRLKMLHCEYGGMNDVLATIYAITGNKKYLDLSYKFFDDFVMEPLSKRIDPMPGKHSNTNVPKAIGSAAQYELTGRETDKTIASFFWETMVHHHSYVIGGNSSYEYCGAEDKLSDRLSDNTCETCNTYNMLKLTRHLFCWEPSASYGDYYERALYNHILASQNPENGMMTYFVPLRMGTQKEFSDSFHTFTCCVGTGMENHSKYGEGIYYKGSDGSLYVNLFIPSTLQWKEKGLSVTQQTDYPASGHTAFSLALTKPAAFPIRIRKPWWAKKAPVVKINGKNYSYTTDANGFLLLSKQWKDKDQVTVDFTMDLYAEAMPDNKDRIALLYGPLVLAGQLGDSLPDPVYGIPVLLTDDKNVSDWLKPVPGKSLQFAMQKVGTPFDATLVPFYQTYKQHYTVYWDYFSPAAWENKKAAYEAEKKRQREIEASTVDYFRIGEMQPERDHNLKATERSYVDNALGVNGREARANNHFSFTMKVDSAKNNSLLLVYLGDDKDRRFDILVDGKLLTTVDWKGGEANKFFPMEYPLPAAMTSGKTSISVSIEANHGTTTARVFGVRTILTKTI